MSEDTYGARRIDWNEGTWTHEPAATRVQDGGLYVSAVEGSDAWRHTAYGFVHDSEHALLAPFAPHSAMEVEFTAAFSAQFDQAGLFVRASADRWVKAGIEFADGVPLLGAVVTDGRSDWSVAPVPDWLGARVLIRVSWDHDALTVRAARVGDSEAGSNGREERAERGAGPSRSAGEAPRLVRLLPFDAASGVTAGPLVCAPTRAGLEVAFHAWRATDPDRSLH